MAPGPMQITVKFITGKTLNLGINPDEKVMDVKRRIHDKEGMPTEMMRLIWQGKQLEEGRTVGDYGISQDSIIYLLPWSRGG